MKLSRGLFTLVLIPLCLSSVAQSKINHETVKEIVRLNQELDFVELAKKFDTTGRKRVNPYVFHAVWTMMRDEHGAFIKSTTKISYTKNNIEYIIEEFEFDSGYYEIKMGFNDKNRLTTYLLHHQVSKADLALEQKYHLPQYVASTRIKATEVNFGSEPFIINGELTLPAALKDKDKVAAIVLVHGSGPGDRDAKNGPLRPFKDMAYGLGMKGVAVLRYEKRTKTYPEECAKDTFFTVDKEVVDDAVEAVKFLRTQKNINPSKIIVLGHSLGGMMLPRIAQRDTALAGIIFMAAPAGSLPAKALAQLDYLASLEPEKKEAYEDAKLPWARIHEKRYDNTTNPRYLPAGTFPAYWLDLEEYSQTEEAKKLQVPMLFLQGERDYQVTIEDFNLWKEALKGKNNTSFVLLNNLNHMMITGTGQSTPKEYKVPGNVPVIVIDTIVKWVNGLE